MFKKILQYKSIQKNRAKKFRTENYLQHHYWYHFEIYYEGRCNNDVNIKIQNADFYY